MMTMSHNERKNEMIHSEILPPFKLKTKTKPETLDKIRTVNANIRSKIQITSLFVFQQINDLIFLLCGFYRPTG